MNLEYLKHMNKAFERIVNADAHGATRMMSSMKVWEWNSGVCLYGIIRAHESLGDKKYLDYLQQWLDKMIPKRKTGSVNRVIPACAAQYVYSKTGDKKYLDICEEYADWCLHKAIRTENGGYGHVWGPGDDGVELGAPEYAHQLWLDSLYMSCIFLFRYGTMTGDEAIINEGLNQVRIHIDSTWDDSVRLCRHAYDCTSQKHLGHFWGRGNGWVAVALVELLRLYPKADEYFYNKYKSLMKMAYDSKSENGMLHTLINVPDSYCESTGSMLFGYAAAEGARMGLLGDEYAAWAAEIADNLEYTPNGAVMYASDGTGPDAEDVYKNVAFRETTYSNGLVLQLLSSLK